MEKGKQKVGNEVRTQNRLDYKYPFKGKVKKYPVHLENTVLDIEFLSSEEFEELSEKEQILHLASIVYDLVQYTGLPQRLPKTTLPSDG